MLGESLTEDILRSIINKRSSKYMTRNLKALGLTLVAALALAALTASAAFAEAPAHFTASEGTTTVSGTSAEFNQKFTTTAGSVECTGTFKGEAPENGTAENMTIKASYTPCRSFFGSQPVISMGSCDYNFTAGTYIGSGTSIGSAHIECTNTKEPITISAPGCTITVKGGQTVGPIHYENSGGSIIVTPEVTGIAYSHSGFLCGSGSGTNGTYTGPVTVSGTNSEGGATEISITST